MLVKSGGMIPITKNIRVFDEHGTEYEATYPKRAKGLVKNGRARFIDEHAICLACPPNLYLEDNMSKSLLKFFVVFVLVLTLCLTAACRREVKDDGTIRIGVLLPMSGPEAFFGTDMFNAYTLAVRHVNQAGGVLGRQLVLQNPGDDGCDALMAAQAATTITSQRPDFVVGGYCSGATIPALQEFYDRNLIMLISAANSTRITELGLPQTFMINSPGTHAVNSLVELLKHFNVRDVALIHQGCAYTQNLAEIAQSKLPEAGLRVVATEVMRYGAPDISAIVTTIRASGAQAIYWCGYHADGANAIRQLRAGGFAGYIIAGDGSADAELIEFSGPAGEGVFVTSPPFVQFSPGGEEFLAAFIARFGNPPGAYASLAYDTIWLLKTAIEQAETLETAKVRDAIQNIRFPGLSGYIRFADNRELYYSNFMIVQIKGGQFVLFDEHIVRE